MAAEEKLYRVALREALAEEMERDDSVYLVGEDIGKFGGAYRVTEGLLDRFGSQRVVDAPIAEEVIVGSAIGSAMLGLRPVVELMTLNFSLIACDQIVNNAAKIRYMFGGEAKVPLVIRMPGGAGHQLSAQHSHSLEVLYGLIPGLLVSAHSTPEHAHGRLSDACLDRGDGGRGAGALLRLPGSPDTQAGRRAGADAVQPAAREGVDSDQRGHQEAGARGGR